MQRLFRRWDVNMNHALSLQDVVTGFAQVKGTKDIMSNISYFFELYDDDGDGKVDREGILRISEALLFLSRRGFENMPSPSASLNSLQPKESANNVGGGRENRDEQILSSISAFIRRCFEYADPDHAVNHSENSSNQLIDTTEKAVDAFSIGDDEDEDDLLSFSSRPSSPKPPTSLDPSQPTTAPPPPSSSLTPKSDKHTANAALDPTKPLYITLPTFRMLILADETLESFFESAFANSFRLADIPSSAPTTTNLTTFANVNAPSRATSAQALSLPQDAAVVAGPGGKGLRGMLDNIVSDGMRVAAEVRRRMEEAQREMDRAAAQGNYDEDEEEERVEADRKSVRDADRDLLEGAETVDVEAGELVGVPVLDGEDGRGKGKENLEEGRRGGGEVVEFER